MKMRAVKTVHHPKRVRNFNRCKRLILASLTSAVLIFSIIYMGSFPLTAQSGSGGSSNFFEIYIGNATMTNTVMKGPCIYNVTYNSDGVAINVTIEVTNVTADVANILNMSLVKDGSMLELESPSAFATKLMVYTTYLTGWMPMDGYLVQIECYGNGTVSFPPPYIPPGTEISLVDVYMRVVYLQAESFSTQLLNLTYT